MRQATETRNENIKGLKRIQIYRSLGRANSQQLLQWIVGNTSWFVGKAVSNSLYKGNFMNQYRERCWHPIVNLKHSVGAIFTFRSENCSGFSLSSTGSSFLQELPELNIVNVGIRPAILFIVLINTFVVPPELRKTTSFCYLHLPPIPVCKP